MTINVAINGFGRIGRAIARIIFEYYNSNSINLVAINSSANLETLKHILIYDSIHGKFNKKVEIIDNKLVIENKEIKIINEKNPSNLPWKDLNINLVFECTGAFTSIKEASKHIESGAQKVIISAPAKENSVKTIIYGVNDNLITKNDQVVSIGSCTTNCLAPIAKILNDEIGSEKGLMTTIHAYTNDQNIVDNSHKDLRRARAATMSMIPTSTGAAKAIGLVIPELNGKLDGVAIRVPTPNVSMIDFTFIAKNSVSSSQINQSQKIAKILAFINEPLVSIDFNHSTQSSCFDATQTKVLDKNLVKIASWYDNEWAFSCRMVDVAQLLFI